MLVLSRKKDERIVMIGSQGEITVQVVKIFPNRVKIGIKAPQDVSVLRHELLHQKRKK